jgi:hypothetical protein
MTGNDILGLFTFLDAQAWFLILVCLLAWRSMSKIIGGENPVEAWHFIATKTSDGVHYGDATKLGIVVGIFGSTLMVGYMFWSHRDVAYNWHMVAIFLIWLTAIYGVEMFAKWARQLASKVAEKKLGTIAGQPEPKP